ncbi:MAG: hypothetical protein AB7S49_02580 [Arcobacter sp.]|jgi:hypothetical protein|uniref:Uncharacterized protein n=1 Tax=Arcobacter defluvii TaxID=873191 RepID=A0AAE7BH97_9BACT|nr:MULTISPECIES: hypothetical protein [Arcobacter]MDY3199765.1 hypothetical protein [Arcobacter sp.]QKF77709.1 hypothetical protein ADFLV_1689 [Arcobacter defluvii]RXI34319.1 hypothetical protein CP964_02910 [Arcobacter defluvii]BAK73510.1 hypothetical protein ABLL_1635 [Arcobacter sp. L]
MSYLDICIIGWNLNALMFVLNFLIAIRVISNQDRTKLQEESLVLKELKEELDKYYPYRTYATVLAYMVPFTAFFRISFRLVEMFLFFQKNEEAKLFDYMVYKYSYDIEKARNK